MKNVTTIAISLSSTYLFVFLLMINLEYIQTILIMFSFSPVVIITMVYVVIRYGRFEGNDLAEDEEWRYEDRTF